MILVMAILIRNLKNYLQGRYYYYSLVHFEASLKFFLKYKYPFNLSWEQNYINKNKNNHFLDT